MKLQPIFKTFRRFVLCGGAPETRPAIGAPTRSDCKTALVRALGASQAATLSCLCRRTRRPANELHSCIRQMIDAGLVEQLAPCTDPTPLRPQEPPVYYRLRREDDAACSWHEQLHQYPERKNAPPHLAYRT